MPVPAPRKPISSRKPIPPKQPATRHDASSYPYQPSWSSIASAEDMPTRYVEAKELSYFSYQDIRTVQIALNEMAACRELFDSWAARLDESRFGRQSKLEGQIKSQISALQDDAEGALLQTDHIAKALQSFSRIMARRLQSAADMGGILEPAPGIEQTAREIQAHSAEMSYHVEQMCEKLRELVETLDQVRRENKSLKERIWRWLKKIFDGLTALLAVGALIATPVNPLIGGLLGLGSVISTAASVISSNMSEKASNQDNEIFKFLQETIPQEAQEVDRSLQNFNAYQEVIRLELEIASGNLVKLEPDETRRAQDFWDMQDTTLQLIQCPRSWKALGGFGREG